MHSAQVQMQSECAPHVPQSGKPGVPCPNFEMAESLRGRPPGRRLDSGEQCEGTNTFLMGLHPHSYRKSL